MKNIKLFTILFFAVISMYAQKNENSKLSNDEVISTRKGGGVMSNNYITFTPENQTISAPSGTDVEATIRLNCYGGNAGVSVYNIFQVSGSTVGIQGINGSTGSMFVGDVHNSIITFNLSVSTATTHTYGFKVLWSDEVGNNFDKDLSITVNYSTATNDSDSDIDGDGVLDSVDGCIYLPGPASNNGCPECNLPSPSNLLATNIGSTQAILNWSNVSGNQSYRVLLRISGSNTPFSTFGFAGANVTSYNKSNLIPNTVYEWRVMASCSSYTYGEQSQSSYFTTLPACNLNAPSGLTTFDVTASTAAITWNSVVGSYGYDMQYKNINYSNWIDLSNGNPNIGFSVFNLVSGGIYKVRVRAISNNGGKSDWSGVYEFTTPICNKPSYITTLNLSSSIVNISWSGVSGSLGYDSEYRELGANNWITISNNNLGSGFSVINLSPLTSYEVRVRSRCQIGIYSDWKYQSFVSSSRLAQTEVRLFPNPTKDKINIESDIRIKNWKIMNSMGIIQRLNNDAKEGINVSALPFGFYTIHIELENEDVVVKRFAKH